MTEKFVVNAIRQLIVDNNERYCELVTFLVHSTSMEQAQNIIENHLKLNESNKNTNISGQEFFWKFVEVESVNPIIFENDDGISEIQIKTYDDLDSVYQAIE